MATEYRDRVRCAALVLEGDLLLLVRYCIHGETFWSLPGGAPFSGESPEMTARREVTEETGLTLGALRLLFVSDHTYRSGIGIDRGGPGGCYHELGLYFAADGYSGEVVLGDEPEHGGHGLIRAVEWAPVFTLHQRRFYPSHLVGPLQEAAATGCQQPVRYIEDRSNHDFIAPLPPASPGHLEGE